MEMMNRMGQYIPFAAHRVHKRRQELAGQEGDGLATESEKEDAVRTGEDHAGKQSNCPGLQNHSNWVPGAAKHATSSRKRKGVAPTRSSSKVVLDDYNGDGNTRPKKMRKLDTDRTYILRPQTRRYYGV